MQAIQSATKWVAEGFRIDEVGSLEPGKFADVLIVNADPLASIRNTRNIHMVLKGGEILDRDYHSWYKGGMFSLPDTDDDPVVSGEDWAAALKDATFRPGAGGNLNVQGPGAPPPPVPDPALAPTPGMESFAPYVVHRGSPDTVIAITGFNFVKESIGYFDGEPLPTRVVSETELQMTVPANLLSRAGKYEIVVKNRPPLDDVFWGDTSNSAYLLVPFEYTKLLAEPNW
jgi:hypothetical protein